MISFTRARERAGALAHLEFNRTIPDQFAVDFHRNVLLRRDAEARGLKIFHLGQIDRGAEDLILEITDDIEIAGTFKDENIEKTVIA